MIPGVSTGGGGITGGESSLTDSGSVQGGFDFGIQGGFGNYNAVPRPTTSNNTLFIGLAVLIIGGFVWLSRKKKK